MRQPHGAMAPAAGVDVGLRAKAHTRYVRLDEGSGYGAIASGSFGRVYAAVDSKTQATVAVKRQALPSTSAQRELCFYKAAGQGKHDNVMQLLDHFTATVGSHTFLYMVFEFMDTTLWRFWQHRRRLVSPVQTHGFIAQVVSGVAHLHSLDIVHSDLSMANILVGGCEPSLRIADFGGAMDAANMVLKAGAVITTEYARAPEIFLGTRRPTVGIDLWALGVVSVALLVGSLIFWQGEGCEPRVVGLKGPTSPVHGVESAKMVAQGLPTLHNQVAFLGPVSDDVWPECASLPAYGALQALLRGRGLSSCAAAFLADGSLVRRPLAVDEEGSSFVLSLLRWDPDKRLRAKACLEHSFLQRACQTPVFVQTLVNSMSEKVLREAVLQSIVSGAPVTQQMLCTMLEQVELPPAKRAKVESAVSVASEPPQDDAQGNSQKSTNDAVAASQATVVASEATVAARQASMCECRANCPMKACKSAKNKERSHVTQTSYCKFPKLQGERFCAFCKCERCSSPRLKIRWCVRCDRDTHVGSHQYANAYGVFDLPKQWPMELKLAARLAYVTTMAPSADASAWSSFVEKLLQFRGHTKARQLAEPGEWFLLFVVGATREPLVVQDACGFLRGCEPVTATVPEWEAYVQRLLVSVDQLGSDTLNGSTQWCLQVVREHPVVWPPLAASQEVPTAEQVSAFANSCSKLVNLLSREESTQSVVCARFLTLLELDFGSSVWDATPMRDVLQWVTEGGGHCSQLLKMSGREVRERFGMSPLLVPWHARMWSMVQKTHIPRLLKTDESKLLNVAAASQAMHSHLPQPHEWVPTACVSTIVQYSSLRCTSVQ